MESFSLQSKPAEIKAVLNVQPAVSMMECEIPLPMISILNRYIDQNRGSAKSYADNLVGQINQHSESSQLALNQKDKVPKSFVKILEKLASSYIATMGYNKYSVDCHDIWTVHSYAGDYNPLHNHYVESKIGLSCILYLKLSEEMVNNKDNAVDLKNASGNTDGYTFFNWGSSGTHDVDMMRYSTETYVKPVVGKLVMFPHWLKHSVNPFFGEGERRTLSANFNVRTNDTLRTQICQLGVKT